MITVEKMGTIRLWFFNHCLCAFGVWAYYGYDYEGDSEEYLNDCFEYVLSWIQLLVQLHVYPCIYECVIVFIYVETKCTKFLF